MNNKCEYCTFDQFGYGALWPDGNTILRTEIIPSRRNYFWIDVGDEVTGNLKYCPMCGRKLINEK